MQRNDHGLAVAGAYRPPFAWTGELSRVAVDVQRFEDVVMRIPRQAVLHADEHSCRVPSTRAPHPVACHRRDGVSVPKIRDGDHGAPVDAAARRLDVGEEPDPRFTLANERTFLAWTRTALALLAAGLGVAELLRSEPHAARLAISVPLILVAGVIGVMSYPRWRALERALRLKQPLPYSLAAAPLSIAIGLIALAAVIVVAVR